ncbi:MAG: hypothetical protein COU65_01040 [Candidatus Pacebacteria bacterium CG10_big_fil_rev_8_21_14_0_10_42_12]|nr:hypothetical protein [Candidatus Paceibacterota bacterium]PIR62893.1 MAG: hypothetical protein COU65_01040 [Candidatus Pacebacteria bacterium CG10_big_fil_rev_8_21_14_0_10_42_12]
MPAQQTTPATSLSALNSFYSEKRAQYIRDLPEYEKYFPVEIAQEESEATTDEITNIEPSSELTHIPTQERQEIFQKLQSLCLKPPTNLEKKEQLYLEQQLSDLFGFEVTTELDEHKLPRTFGKMQAVPISKRRSPFGWAQQDSGEAKFEVSAHLLLLDDWHLKYAHYKKWYRNRHLLIVNPFEQRAVVAKLTDCTLPNPSSYQFGGSSRVIREGKIWSPMSQGIVAVFFIPPNDSVHPGRVNLDQ